MHENVEDAVDVRLGREVVHDPGAEPRSIEQRRRRDPSRAAYLERALQALLIRVERLGAERAVGDVPEADDGELRLDDVEADDLGAPPGEIRREVVGVLYEF